MAKLDTARVLERARQLQIRSTRRVRESHFGEARSFHRGQGLQFSQHRVYVPGDDVRRIDWKATARSKDTLIKEFEEDRDRRVILILDVSSSMCVQSLQKSKYEVALEAFAYICQAAVFAKDRVGAIFYSNKIEEVIPASSKINQGIRLIAQGVKWTPVEEKGSSGACVLEELQNRWRAPSVVVWISDFAEQGIDFSKVSRKHDLYMFQIVDPIDLQLPDIGFFDSVSSESNMVSRGHELFQKVPEAHQILTSDEVFDVLEKAFRLPSRWLARGGK